MLTTAEGIVLHTLKYGDTSAIAKIYTPSFGLVAVLLKGAYRKGKGRGALQPLNLVEISFYRKDDGSLSVGKEINITQPYSSLQSDFFKGTVGIFIAEFLYKVLKTEETEATTYDFIKNSLVELDKRAFHPLFHLWFVSSFSKFAGFFPALDTMENSSAFLLPEGVFSKSGILYPSDTIEGEELILFKQILTATQDDLSQITSHYKTRRELLSKLLWYYQLHFPEMGEMASHKILHDVLQ